MESTSRDPNLQCLSIYSVENTEGEYLALLNLQVFGVQNSAVSTVASGSVAAGEGLLTGAILAGPVLKSTKVLELKCLKCEWPGYKINYLYKLIKREW